MPPRASQKKRKKTIVSETIKAFIAKRIVDSVALVAMAACFYGFISLISFHPNDPSLNHSGQHDLVFNFGGLYGAYISDIAVQSFGVASIIFFAVPFYWAYKLLRRQSIAFPLALRFCAFLIALPFASAVTAWIAPFYPDQIMLGGAIGGLILNSLSYTMGALSSQFALPMTAFFCAVIATGLTGFACGFGYQNWKSLLVTSAKLAMRCLSTLALCAAAMVSWVKHYDAKAETQSQKISGPSLKDKIITLWQNHRDSEDINEFVAPQTQHDEKPEARMADHSASKKMSTAADIVKPTQESLKVPAQKTLSFTALHDWEFPSIELLQAPGKKDLEMVLDERALQRNADLLQQILADFNVEGEIVKIRPGPVVTLYEFEPAAGVKSSRVIGLADDIARSMSAVSVRAAVVPGRNVIGIEIPNQTRQIVYLRSLLESTEYSGSKAALPMVLGKDIGGKPVIADLAKMPHLLVAGTTGSGKSVAVNTMIMSLVYCLPPEKCRLIMIDPKMLELSVYDDIPHLLSPVVTDPGRAVVALKWAVQEMENRYRAMSKFGVRNIDGYNKRIQEAIKNDETLSRKVQTGFDPESGKPVFEEEAIALEELPYIVVIVDEFADLMLVAGKDVESAIQRLAQMARAAGIHLIMATQRPSVDVITGVIKANFPTRISFQVTSKFDSRTILGDGGAEQLLGMGDMLYMASGGKIQRVHGPFVADDEVEQVVTHLKEQGEPAYLDTVTDGDGEGGMGGLFGESGGEGGSAVDELYDQAVALVAREQKASTSFIQRHLQIGYNRAARIIEEMEKQGVVGPANHVGKREVQVSDHSGDFDAA